MSKKVGVIGAGAWGTAVGKVLAEKGYTVELWEFAEGVVAEINNQHTNTRYLMGVALPEGLRASTDIEHVAEGKEFLFMASPSLYLAPTAQRIARCSNVQKGKATIALLTKGFVSTPEGPLLPVEGVERVLPEHYRGNLVYVSGPSHAEEVSRGKLTGLISASQNAKNSIRIRELLGGTNLMVFSSLDVVGVQVCAAAKNVIAVAFGMLDALMELSDRFGDNTESLLLAAGLNEIQLIGQALGSTHPETFTSIAGVGDLDVTCRSKYGRNRRFGKEIVLDRVIDRFQNLDDLVARIDLVGYLPEGAIAARHVCEIADRLGLRLTICKFVYRILNREIEPLDAMSEMFRLLQMPEMATMAEERKRSRRRRKV